ncbi:stemmadenine O-acetyltransferase-like [Silene latifolia]|uniref:stemmadenine O-acetyltransferase-like n=1 Tax=Silene latifolia TaxID=37657 RepID=UPI003D774C46
METVLLEPEVKIISRETVKPSTLTPPHLRIFNLSMIDQISAPLHVSSLIFYNPTTETQPLDITGLKVALSQTLSQFYPLAGRCKDDSTIICNDEGATFVVAHVNCSLSAVLSSPQKLDFLSKFQFCPPKDILSTGKQHISELVHLAFQVNVFSCGGVVIGCYMLHKILDGTSFGLFFKYWSALARKNYDDLIQPDFDSTVTVFPPFLPEQKEKEEPVNPDYKYYIPTDDSLKIVGKGFIFSDAALTKLKAMATSEYVPNPTRFESVLGFIWERCLAAESEMSKHNEAPVLLFAADIRKRVGAPLSENSIGNLVANPIAFGKTGVRLPELVAEIHDAILKVKDETVNEFISGGAEAVLAHRGKLGGYLAEYKKGTYLVSSWCRNGLNEADFGFGKPSIIVFPVTDGEIIPARRNFISLTDYNDADGTSGTAAWIYLEEKEMQILESNQEFLALASHWE